jgi:hypothetical protein
VVPEINCKNKAGLTVFAVTTMSILSVPGPFNG